MQPQRIPFQKVAKVSNFLNKGISDQCLEFLSLVAGLESEIKSDHQFLLFWPIFASYMYKHYFVPDLTLHWWAIPNIDPEFPAS